jgi:hypothetical protein
VLTLVIALLAPAASAIDLLDGRLQAHGFFEAQIRFISNNYNVSKEFGLTQWYNVFNLELELDVAPDGFGPLEAISFYSRIEVRYDCVWRQACWTSPATKAYGDRASRLPHRFREGERTGFDGTMFTGDTRRLHLIPVDQLGYADKDEPVGRQRRPLFIWHVPGISTLFGVPGTDGVTGTPDDPAFYTFARYVEPGKEYRWSSRRIRGPIDGRQNEFLGPWLPDNEIIPIAALADRANPFEPRDFNPSSGGFGSSRLPYRPSPGVKAGFYPARGKARGRDPAMPQGLYIPNEVMANLIRNEDLSDFDQNFSQTELSWNRGASQQDTKELKEAYFDIDLFEGRLWVRAGKQSIVWGKTELFRTTDQFNPVDLALASLPSLEEARIPLWAVRGVWSFGEIGPLQDVRLELAANIQEFEPIDLGRCGEPYTPNPVCAKTLGLFAHGVAGIGLAGEIRPPSPWDDPTGFEIGGRVEFRAGRFSFALTDFYGYDDRPYIEQMFVYERNVDPITGRPRRGNSRAGCDPGSDISGCLRPDDDALHHHHANQQRFALICSSSIGFSDLDRSVCAQSVFNSLAIANPDTDTPALDLISVQTALSNLLAGDRIAQASGGLLTALVPGLPLAFNGGCPGSPLGGPGAMRVLVCLSWDGPFDDTPPASAARLAAALASGKITSSVASQFAVRPLWTPSGPLYGGGLANTLSDEQEALLGCGRFWGTDCDIDGIDLLNAEMSALLQSWPGIPGTFFDWNTTRKGVAQPGTVGFRGGPVCTRYERGQIFVLPGCRGPGDKGYNIAQDGDPTKLAPHPFTGQRWRSEMAALSWNYLIELVGLSGLGVEDAQRAIDEFKASEPFRTGACSFANPQFCSNVMAIFSIAHTKRRTIRAGGNGEYGRVDLDWHGGGDGVVRYAKRNVLGLSFDVAEDRFKTNWSGEFTWVGELPFRDHDEFDGLRSSDTFNLTLSVDRPTFINFLNANRTILFNTQWFFQYRPGYRESWPSNGPWNVLMTFTATTGYFQDRLLMTVTTVYDFASNSGGFLPSATWRFSGNFSVVFGLAAFWGRDQTTTPPITTVGSPPFRAGAWANTDFVENGLSPIRERDEIFFRLRYTF